MFDELATELKTARENNSMTLVQVANKSKIDIKFLEAMEQGDFAFLPELYVRAFVKNFARTVGLDENKIFKKYEAARKGIPYVEEEPPKKELKIRPAETPKPAPQKPIIQNAQPEIKKRDSLFTFDAVGENNPAQNIASSINKRSLIIGVSVLGAVLLFTLIYFLFIDKGDQTIVVEKPIEDVIQQNQRYVEDEQATSNDMGVGVTDSLVLMINANDTSWIKVSIDDQVPVEFILLPNSQKIVKAKTNYKLTLGNSGAIKLQMNNRQLPFSGKSKTPLNLVIDKKGLKYLAKSPSQR